VGGVYKAPMGSFAYEFVVWDTARVRELFE